MMSKMGNTDHKVDIFSLMRKLLRIGEASMRRRSMKEDTDSIQNSNGLQRKKRRF